MQDAYVRACTHLRDFDGRSRFATWARGSPDEFRVVFMLRAV